MACLNKECVNMSSVCNEKLLGENATYFCYGQTDRRTARKNDERIDRQTMVKQNTPSPCEQGYNKNNRNYSNNCT